MTLLLRGPNQLAPQDIDVGREANMSSTIARPLEIGGDGNSGVSPEAFAEFVDRNHAEMVRFANRNHPGCGEDATQTVLLRLWCRRDQHTCGELRPLAYASLKNLLIDEHRRAAVVSQVPHDFTVAPDTVGATSVQCDGLARPAVASFVDSLAEPLHRQVVAMRWLWEFNELEIVRELGLSRRRVRTILGNARRELCRRGLADEPVE